MPFCTETRWSSASTCDFVYSRATALNLGKFTTKMRVGLDRSSELDG